MGFQASVILLATAATVFSSGSYAQHAALTLASASKPDSAETIRVTTNLVLVPVLVMDRYNQFVMGLHKDDFKLYDDRVQQDIRFFTSEDIPISAVLLLDTSGSMVRKLPMSGRAVREFLKTSNPDDEFSLIQFSDEPRVLAPFTQDHARIEKWLPFVEAHGWTALLDAIDLALNELKYARHARKAIFIISDGGDNRSRHTATEVQRRVTEANVQIYSIGIFSPFETDEQTGATLLRSIARATGGRLFKVDDPNMLPETAQAIGNALRNQYVLGYSPSSDKSDGKYHRIEVKVAQPKGSPKLVTSFRSSYLAPAR